MAATRCSSARAAIAAGLLLTLALGCGARDVRMKGANVVLFSVDTWRADHLSLYGYTRPTSPALERLAGDAIVFDRAFSAAPQTAPSHMSMLTGVPPLVHGIVNIGFTGRTVRTLSPVIRTLAEMLKAHGYRTGAFTGAGNVGAAFGFGRGFDRYEQDPLGGMSGNDRRSLEPAQAVAWLAQAKAGKAPFFLFLHTYIPHAPYLPPPPFDSYDPDYRGRVATTREEFFKRHEDSTNFGEIHSWFWADVDQKSPEDLRHLIALYDGECNTADEAVATFVRAIDDAGLRDDTIFIVTSDHGEEFLEHGSFIHPGELWDELIHVPLVMALPGSRGRGRRIAAPVSSLDLVPTILDLVGLPADPQPIGHSLVPLLEGVEEGPERPVVSEFVAKAAGARTFEPTVSLRSLRTARHKLIRRIGSGRPDELYDLVADPGEARSILADPAAAEILGRLRASSDALDRVEVALRAPSGRTTLSAETLNQLRALGYIR